MDHNMVLSYDYAKQKKAVVTRKWTSIADHFDGHVDALKRYGAHLPMHHDQGYTGRHWTPPSGNYLLRIAPATARATANKTTMANASTLLAILMAMVVRRYNTVCITRWRRFMTFLNVTKRRHRVSTRSDHKSDMPTPVMFGIFQLSKKGSSWHFGP